MKKITKLKICDWTLLFLTIAILASGLQLEMDPMGNIIWVWTHITLGSIFLGIILWHVGLHQNAMLKRQPQSKRRGIKHPFLGILFILTLISGIIASCHWIGSYIHSTIGGVHGKIGFLFIIVIIAHIIKNHRFFYKRPAKRSKGA